MSDICSICNQRCYVKCVGKQHYEKLQIDLEKMRKNLMKYGKHSMICQKRNGFLCNCGFDIALKGE